MTEQKKVLKAAQWKKDDIKQLVQMLKENTAIGVVNMARIPCAQLQKMNIQLRGKAKIFMTRKKLMELALDEAEKNKPGIKELKKYFADVPALILTKDNPFILYKTLEKNRSNAPAKIGQICPREVIIPAGPTPFPPGPIISELSSVGIKAGIENGKVCVKADATVAKKGTLIDAKLVSVFTKFGVEPMEIGLDLLCAYEGGQIYSKDVLGIDEKDLYNKIVKAASICLHLSMNLGIANKDNASSIVGKAYRQAKGLAAEAKLEVN